MPAPSVLPRSSAPQQRLPLTGLYCREKPCAGCDVGEAGSSSGSGSGLDQAHDHPAGRSRRRARLASGSTRRATAGLHLTGIWPVLGGHLAGMSGIWRLASGVWHLAGVYQMLGLPSGSQLPHQTDRGALVAAATVKKREASTLRPPYTSPPRRLALQPRSPVRFRPPAA